MTLKKRLAVLEKHVTDGAALLRMPDGSVVMLPGDSVVGLPTLACRGERTREIELVAQSVSSTEPGGAQMIDLARAIWNSPRE